MTGLTGFVTGFTRALGAGALCIGALALGGCAFAPTSMTSNVQSFAQMQGVELPTTYRLELLPSQMQEAGFAQVEAAAEAALAKVGLSRLNNSNSSNSSNHLNGVNGKEPPLEQARLVAQISAHHARQAQPWAMFNNPFYYGPRFAWGLGYGAGYGGVGHHQWHGTWVANGWLLDTPPAVRAWAVKIVLREQASQRIVYETAAQYEEVRIPDSNIWHLLFEAALSGFPQPGSGLRAVTLAIPKLPPQPPQPHATPPPQP
ncbi:MAG: hypothetical protein KIG95_08800 [Comamonas sp.]|nr:hypothetical protein [Comamonas sp.]